MSLIASLRRHYPYQVHRVGLLRPLSRCPIRAWAQYEAAAPLATLLFTCRFHNNKFPLGRQEFPLFAELRSLFEPFTSRKTVKSPWLNLAAWLLFFCCFLRLACSRPRMCGFIYGSLMCRRNMRIDLRHAQTGMAQHFLNAPQICAAL